jgi:Fe-S-cluster containining protein
MNVDLMPHFKKYESLVAQAEKVFARVKEQYPDAVKCQKGCADCCHALFDLTLIEALYLNHQFNERFSGTAKADLLEKASKTDRQIYKIKKAAYRSAQTGKSEDAVVEEMGQKRIRCPLLGQDNLCEMYDYRPIACRVYGIPQAIGGKGRTCGLSGFVSGEKYPTVNHDLIHDQLMILSADLVAALRSRHARMAEVLVPLSMALITDYDETYLGLSEEELTEEQKPEDEANE